VENTLSQPTAPLAADPTLLRRALLLDAVASGALGLAMALATGPLADLLGLPPGLLRWAGVALLPFAALLAFLGGRAAVPPAAAMAVVAVNLLWVAGSLLLLGGGWVEPTALGVAFVVAQALAVALFAGLQARGLAGTPVAR